MGTWAGAAVLLTKTSFCGIGFRVMTTGAVFPFDRAASDEGATAWVMFGHLF